LVVIRFANMPIANGVLNAGPGSILVFVDETGHEQFADNKYPVFGLGGCLFPTNDSTTIVDTPWKTLKQMHFPETTGKAFHAAEIKSATPKQAEALGAFFRQNPLRRFACVIRASASNPDLITTVHVAVPTAVNQIKELLKNVPLTAIHVVWEDSDRLNQALSDSFSQILFTSTAAVKIPTTYSALPKLTAEPGLEIADCIIHTAGCQVRNNMKKKSVRRRDFEAIFCSRSKAESAFVEIDGFQIEGGGT